MVLFWWRLHDIGVMTVVHHCHSTSLRRLRQSSKVGKETKTWKWKTRCKTATAQRWHNSVWVIKIFQVAVGRPGVAGRKCLWFKKKKSIWGQIWKPQYKTCVFGTRKTMTLLMTLLNGTATFEKDCKGCSSCVTWGGMLFSHVVWCVALCGFYTGRDEWSYSFY